MSPLRASARRATAPLGARRSAAGFFHGLGLITRARTAASPPTRRVTTFPCGADVPAARRIAFPCGADFPSARRVATFPCSAD